MYYSFTKLNGERACAAMCRVEQLPEKPAHHIKVLLCILDAAPSIKLPINAFWVAADNGSSAWTLPPTWETGIKFSPGVQPGPGNGIFSFSLSLCFTLTLTLLVLCL